ncbi:MAG: 2-iminoacetate synthase ThiH, partial [Lachnospiraceae bacterium]|nr:2-iminoacetate synthase ThiH [Lachnospiraceae bacterium]
MSSHINESILNDEIKEHLKENRTNHMEYFPEMEQISGDIMEQVIDAMNAYDYERYTEEDVKRALAKENTDVEDFAALLSPAALPHLEEIAKKAQKETRKHFGNNIYSE